MIQACIFDLDGVITDTAKYHFIAWRKLANQLGFDFDEAFNERLKGVGRMESLEIILQHGGLTLSADTKEHLAESKNQWYKELIEAINPSEILPGTLELLEELDGRGIKIGLGSASKNAQAVLKGLGIAERFQAIIDGTKTTEDKPNPQVFLMAAEALNAEPSQSVVFEDAAKGVQAALNGGFIAVGVGSPEHLGHAHAVVSGLHEVTLDWLMNLKES